MVLSFFRKDKLYSPNDKLGEYIIDRVMGEGRYGICYLAKKNNTYYIIKQLKIKMLKKSGHKANFEQEILMKIENDYIPKFIENIQFDKFKGYVLEYIEGKTFEEIIFKDEYKFSKKEILDICHQLIQLMKYLHNMNIVHRDIRVPNTLYINQKLYLLDFGLARWVNSDRYTVDIDFSYLGDFLLHLYYTNYEPVGKDKPWYEELDLPAQEMLFLKRLFGMEDSFQNIFDVEDFFTSNLS